MPYDQHPNPYINPLANRETSNDPTRRMDKQFLRGNYANDPSMAQFGVALNQRYQDIDNQADPLAFAGAGEAGGALGNRIRDLNRDRASQGVFGQRFGYIGQRTNEAANRLQQGWMFRNQLESGNLASAAGLENQRYNWYQKPNLFSQFAGAALGGFGSYMGARQG